MKYPFLIDSIGISVKSFAFVPDTVYVPTEVSHQDILSLLNDIYVDGTGYNDVIGVIAFPLIIALFAFSFPFVFERINQINDKYQSKKISNLFSSSCRYKLFWIASYASVIYVFCYGILALQYRDSVLVSYSRVWNVLSLTISIFYALSVCIFARSAIRYNNPDKLLDIVIDKFKRGKKSNDKASCIDVNIQEERLVDYLLDISRYAIRNKDFNLFSNILEKLEYLINIERNKRARSKVTSDDVIQEAYPHCLAMNFFVDLMTFYSPFSNSFMENEELVFKMTRSFDRSKFMNRIDSFKLGLCVRRMIDGDNVDLLKRYVDYTSYFFCYLRQLPQIYFIKGGNIGERPTVEKQAYESWTYLAIYHYAALAYGFDKGKYTVIDIHLNHSHNVWYNLYPHSGADLLIRYAQCLNHFWGLVDETLFGNENDVDGIFSRYTAALLMIVHMDDDSTTEEVSPDIIKKLTANKDNLQKAAEQVKRNAELNHVYSKLQTTNFDECFDYYYQLLVSSNISDLEIATDVDFKKDDFGSFSLEWSLPQSNQYNCYKMSLNDDIKQDFEKRLMNIEHDLVRYTNYDMRCESRGDLEHSLEIGPCQCLIHKQFFLSFDIYHVYENWYIDFLMLFASRLNYLILSAFRNMKKDEKFVSPKNFDSFFKKYTKGCIKDYVLIGVDSSFSFLLNIKYNGLQQYYQEVVPFYQIDASRFSPSLEDLDDYVYFKKSILIVPKSYLPRIINKDENDGMSFSYDDTSSEENMIFKVRVTIDMNKILVYNKNKKINVVRFKKI